MIQTSEAFVFYSQCGLLPLITLIIVVFIGCETQLKLTCNQHLIYNEYENCETL